MSRGSALLDDAHGKNWRAKTQNQVQKDYKYSKVNSHDFPQLNFTDFAGCENHAKVFL